MKKKYPDARIVSVKQEKERNKGKPIYYVSLERGKEEMDVDVDADGKIFSEETHVEFSAVPDQVQKGLKNSPHGDWTVKRVERVILGEKEEPPRRCQERSRADGGQGTPSEVATLGSWAPRRWDLQSLNTGVNDFSLISALIK